MREIKKSLRVFFMIIALLLFSQVFGTAERSGSIWLYLLSIVIILSGVIGFTQLNKIVILLDAIVLVGAIISWVIMPTPWPLYLIYVVYAVVQGLTEWYWTKIADNEEDAS